MSAVAIKGWCPGALRPMRSGDGLVVRIRPHGGRIDAAQAAEVAALAQRYGNGLIDVTSRANLQIRGVGEAGHAPLLEDLARLGLLDATPDSEARRNILVAPFWRAGDDIMSLAAEMEQALAVGPAGLPTKFGFAIDCGDGRVLADAPADIRIERATCGDLIVRADGSPHGRRVTRTDAVPVALALAQWFVAAGGVRDGRGRMAALVGAGGQLPDALSGDAEPARVVARPDPGMSPLGALIGVAFGQLTHAALADLAGRAQALRLTPWRMILAEGLQGMPHGDGFITRADDPRLRVVACSGAPACAEGLAETRALAAALAPRLPPAARLHVSGCAKGCAQSAPASVTLVATRNGFDLVRDGTTRDTPALRGLSGEALLAAPSMLAGGC